MGVRLALVALAAMLVSSCSMSPSSPGEPLGVKAVETGKTVSLNGLEFAVPSFWHVWPASKYGSTIPNGYSIIVGRPGSFDTCPDSCSNPIVTVNLLPVRGESVGGIVGDQSYSVVEIHGVKVELEEGSAVTAGVSCCTPEQRQQMRQPSGTVASLGALFRGYNVQVTATASGRPGESIRATLAPVFAVLETVRPVG